MADRNLDASTTNAIADSSVSRFKHLTRTARLPVLVACLTAGAFVVGTNWRSTDAADPPAGKKSPAASYAQVYLQLAEAQLAYAEHMNSESARTFSDEQLAQYRGSVQIWQKLLKQEKLSGSFDRTAAILYLAEQRLKAAQTELANAQTLNSDNPGTVPPERLKELQAYVTLAQLDTQAGKAAQSGDPTTQLRWRVATLENELMKMRKEVDLIRRTQQ